MRWSICLGQQNRKLSLPALNGAMACDGAPALPHGELHCSMAGPMWQLMYANLIGIGKFGLIIFKSVVREDSKGRLPQRPCGFRDVQVLQDGTAHS